MLERQKIRGKENHASPKVSLENSKGKDDGGDSDDNSQPFSSP
jgi:hypothetical protein